ncbi:hypothetical protein AVEN_32173-1, partial [Araneus ventricosus]
KKVWPESVIKCDIEESETVPCGAYSQRDCDFGQDQAMKVDSKDIGELVEEQNQEMTTEELMQLHCISQREVIQERLSEEEVTPKLQSSSAIRGVLKAWETVASYIEKHHPLQGNG